MSRRPIDPTDPRTQAAPPAAETLDPAALTRDWATLWQSELAALATDREMQEAWQTMLGVWAELWAGAAAAMLRSAASVRPAPADDERFRPSWPAAAAAAPGAAAAAAASDAGDAALGELRQRLAELEQRLARHERGDARRRARPRPRGQPGGRSA